MYRRVVPMMNLNMSNQPSFLRWLYKIMYALTFSPRRTRERARDCGPPQPSRSDGVHGPISPRCGVHNLHLSCRSAVPWMAGAIFCLGRTSTPSTLVPVTYQTPVTYFCRNSGDSVEVSLSRGSDPRNSMGTLSGSTTSWTNRAYRGAGQLGVRYRIPCLAWQPEVYPHR